MAVASEKVLWRVSPTIVYICLPNGCCFIKVLWRVPPTVLYIYLPVSSWVQSCVNCWHVSPIRIQSAENDPSCRCCCGILWAYFIFIYLERVALNFHLALARRWELGKTSKRQSICSQRFKSLVIERFGINLGHSKNHYAGVQRQRWPWDWSEMWISWCP